MFQHLVNLVDSEIVLQDDFQAEQAVGSFTVSRRASSLHRFDQRITDGDQDELFYKEEPFRSKKMEQRLLITYSPKHAAYQKKIREQQVERAKAMLSSGKHRKNRKNPNDPARFIDKTAVTDDGEIAKILFTLDEEKIEQEAQYDGLYAVCTELFDDEPEDILTLVLPINIGKVIKIQLCKIFKVLYGRSESFYKLF